MEQVKSRDAIVSDALLTALSNIERLHNENVELRKKLYEQFDMILKLQARVVELEKARVKQVQS